MKDVVLTDNGLDANSYQDEAKAQEAIQEFIGLYSAARKHKFRIAKMCGFFKVEVFNKRSGNFSGWLGTD
jgi:hypothetical protein